MQYPLTSSAPRDRAMEQDISPVLGYFWFVFWFFVVEIAISLSWDRRWHTTHVFDTFYSPPHLFTYTMSAICGILVAVMVFAPGMRRWFGPTIRVFPFPFPVPAALFFAGAGFVTLAIAGILDDIWHSNFGLDETGWSTPHNMIGWGLLMVMLGFAACRLALGAYRPLSWGATLALTFGILYFSHTPFLGPMANNISPETVRSIAQVPILLQQPAAQHTFRIYVAANLTHTNPLYLILAAFWAGTMLVLLRQLDRRAWIFWTVLLVFSVLQVFDGLSQYVGLERVFHTLFTQRPSVALPVPILPAALVWQGLEALRAPRPVALAVAGLVLGFLGVTAWDGSQGPIIMTLLAAPALLLGGLAGEGIWRAISRPAESRHAFFVALGLAVPLLTGCVDLYLRFTIP